MQSCGMGESGRECGLVTQQPSKLEFYILPVALDNLKGVQWFGPTNNAYALMRKGDTIYAYCNYMHCGLDLLADYGTPVYAGVYGEVVFVSRVDGTPATYEGPWKIQIKCQDYVITYGHTDGIARVSVGQKVTPFTVIAGVGNMAGKPGGDGWAHDHIHLEVRGPGGWNGDSQNPLQFMGRDLIIKLTDVAENQQVFPAMAQLTDGKGSYMLDSAPQVLLLGQISRAERIFEFWRQK